MDEFSSSSAFLWKAATYTFGIHPTITANLMLRCKKALNDTKVGVQVKKVSKKNICQSCGNPWSVGNYTLKIKKNINVAKVKKMIKKTKCKVASTFKKHLLDLYTNHPSQMVVRCDTCLNPTTLPLPLPPREEKLKTNHITQEKQKMTKLNKKDKVQGKSAILHKPPTSNGKQQISKKANKVVKPAVKQKFSQQQLKNISKNLTKNVTNKSGSLQAFLSSVK